MGELFGPEELGQGARDLARRIVALRSRPRGLVTRPADQAAPLVEALEGDGGPWRVAVQCHPERTESTPRVFEQLFAAFVEVCRVR